MTNPANFTSIQRNAGASFAPFPGTDTPTVNSFGDPDGEYTAIREAVGIMHEPQRGLLELRGADARDFLNRMQTQAIAAMKGGDSHRSFQLNVKGRIIADMIVHHGDESTWIEADATDLDGLDELYDSRLFGEDLTITNITADRVALSLHGPMAGDLLRSVSVNCDRCIDMPHTHHVLEVAGRHVTVSRRDVCGAMGLRLWPRADDALHVYGAMSAAMDAARFVGWAAFNTARVEAGSPMYHIDFGPDSLVHETGALDETVSFTKGCYLGQEIVARMENLGHPKRVLTGLRFKNDQLPAAAATVYTESGDVIGAVTSSVISPMLGNIAIAFAMIKWGKHREGTAVEVDTDAGRALATTGDRTFIQTA